MFRAAVVFLSFAVLIAGARIYAKHLDTRNAHQTGWSKTAENFAGGKGEFAIDEPAEHVQKTDLRQNQKVKSKRNTRVSFLVPDAADLMDALQLDRLDLPGREGPRFGPRREADLSASQSALTVKIQSELRRVGCYLGFETGQWDRGTRRAMMRFSRAIKRQLNTVAPTKAALRLLQRSRGSVCFSQLAKIKKPVSAFAVDQAGESKGHRQRTQWQQRSSLQDGKQLQAKSRPPSSSSQANAEKQLFADNIKKAEKLAALDLRDLTIRVQKELIRIGCYDGPVNGQWQGATRRALVRFTRFTETQLVTDRPSRVALEALKLRKGDICLLRARKRERRLAELRAEKELQEQEEEPVSLKLLAGDGSLRSTADTASEPDLRSPEAVRGYLAVLIKTQLRRLGCFRGRIAATWDAEAQDAMVLYNYYSHTNLPVDVPARHALKILTQTRNIVCPVGCFIKGNNGGDEEENDRRCVNPQTLRGAKRSLEAKQDAIVEPTNSQLPSRP